MARASDETLERLVSQFSQPLAFLRELIQNALDAGTNRVDVEVTHEPREGLARVEVIDSGEGMTREIIDEQLTRLFSSTKENDLTRIGKFGIGFVSVFATDPRAVTVDTGKDGQYWRVLFRPDRTFERIARSEPIEGTRVTSYIPVEKSRFAKFARDCRATIVYWCKHCDIEIRFNGTPINEPFDLDMPCATRLKVHGSEVVAAPSLDPEPFYGFYNRGLTLLEGKGSPVKGVAFKLRSQYLEHTLTRDNVVQDENYQKAMAIVRRAVALFPSRILHELATNPHDEHMWQLARLVELDDEGLDQAVVPGFTRCYSLNELRGRVVPYSSQAHPGIEPLIEPRSDMLLALAHWGIQTQPVEKSWFWVQPTECPPAEAGLLAVAKRLLAEGSLQPADFSSCPWLADSLSVLSRTPGQPERYAQKGTLTVNVAHPLIGKLARLSERDPELAGYLLARAVCLEEGGSAERDGKILATAIKLRKGRL